jgi:hypothetical protein
VKDGKKVLFIGHDSSRTGAPLLLLHFFKWLRQETRFEFEVLLQNGGIWLTIIASRRRCASCMEKFSPIAVVTQSPHQTPDHSAGFIKAAIAKAHSCFHPIMEYR